MTPWKKQQTHSSNASILFVPPNSQQTRHEAMESGIKTVVIITEHVPLKDAIG
jgi:succinyl-CoA synthetase alpha subunit